VGLVAVTTYALPNRSRKMRVNRPLGDLVSGRNIELSQVLRELIERERPAKLIHIDDSVSRRASHAGIIADVMVIDNVEKRQRAISYFYPKSRVIRAKNSAGRIEHHARMAVERAIRDEAGLVEIDGEEDLTVIAVLAAH